MFGYAAFAQAPFAALGSRGAVIDVELEEAGSANSNTNSIGTTFVATAVESGSTTSVVNTINNTFNTLITGASSGAGVGVTNAAFSGTVAETATAVAALLALREANVYPTGVHLVVRIGGTLVWAKVDDNQTPNWVTLPS